VALAYEATLRWDDFADTLLGDFIVTLEIVRVFFVVHELPPTIFINQFQGIE
jgi:hypothetical protein